MQTHKDVNPSLRSSNGILNISSFSPIRIATIFLLISNVIWGITPIFLEVVLEYLTPLQITTLRIGVAVVVLSIILFFLKGRSGFSMLSGKTFILLGWLDAFGYLAAVAGQDLTTPGLSTLLSSFYVFLVPFFAWYLEGTKLNWRIGLVGLISLVGIFLISFNGDWSNFANSSMLGIIILMFSAIMWGVYTVVSGKFLDISKNEEKKTDIMSFTYASLFHTFLALSFLTLITGEISFSIPLEIIPHILFSGLFPTIIALGLWNWAIARLGSVRTSFYQLLQVIVPFILEFILFQQIYSAWIYSGVILILMSTFLISDDQNESVEEKEIGELTDQLSYEKSNKKIPSEICC